eukprot:2901192-Rhodomonas_salina.2
MPVTSKQPGSESLVSHSSSRLFLRRPASVTDPCTASESALRESYNLNVAPVELGQASGSVTTPEVYSLGSLFLSDPSLSESVLIPLFLHRVESLARAGAPSGPLRAFHSGWTPLPR